MLRFRAFSGRSFRHCDRLTFNISYFKLAYVCTVQYFVIQFTFLVATLLGLRYDNLILNDVTPILLGLPLTSNFWSRVLGRIA